jgi:phosphatidate cytidylyltransferase
MEAPKLDSGEAMSAEIIDIEMNHGAEEPAAAADTSTPSPWSGLGTRALSSIVLGAIFLAALWVGGWMFTWLAMLAGLMMAREWNTLTENQPVAWRVGGLFYVTIPCASLIWLRNVQIENVWDAGYSLVLAVVLMVAATDIGAYFAGRQFGKRKLAPAISPNKTWEGLGGGVAAAAIVGGVAHTFSPYPALFISSILCGAFVALLAQAGDLFESYVKRRVGVKDSGSLIPGHGGLLDRVDGLTLTVPIFAWLVWLSGQVL